MIPGPEVTGMGGELGRVDKGCLDLLSIKSLCAKSFSHV